MRDGFLGMAAAALLGGAIALGLTTAPQSPVERTQEESTQEEKSEEKPAGQSGTAQAAQGGVTITPDAVDCSVFVGPSKCRGALLFRPAASARNKDFQLKAILSEPDGTPVPATLAIECSSCSGERIHFTEPAVAVRYTLDLPDGWRHPTYPRVASGLIGLSTDGAVFLGTPKKLRVLAPSPSAWQAGVLLLPGAAALLIALGVAGTLTKVSEDQEFLWRRMGAPSWKATDSWASNLTIGGALVTGVLTPTLMPDQTVYMTKPSYSVLAMFLGALVLLAPAVFNFSRRSVEGKGAPASDNFEGPVSMFLAAGALTLWASGGQLLAFALLAGELWRHGVVDGLTAGIIVVLTLVILVLLWKYGRTSMLETASKAKKPPEPAQAAPTAKKGVKALRSVRGSRADEAEEDERAPSWSLL